MNAAIVTDFVNEGEDETLEIKRIQREKKIVYKQQFLKLQRIFKRRISRWVHPHRYLPTYLPTPDLSTHLLRSSATPPKMNQSTRSQSLEKPDPVAIPPSLPPFSKSCLRATKDSTIRSERYLPNDLRAPPPLPPPPSPPP